jgi:hypothetical protein
VRNRSFLLSLVAALLLFSLTFIGRLLGPSTPEYGTLALLSTGLLGIAGFVRRKFERS